MTDPNIYSQQGNIHYGAPQTSSYHYMYEQVGNNKETQQSATVSQNNGELTNNGICKKFIHGKCKKHDCPHSHDRSKIKACDNYQRSNNCGYGEKCNFSHDVKICPKFSQQGGCLRQSCQYRHVYKLCPNFEMGFCGQGNLCRNKHITRKLCWDYMYGYCQKGNKCTDHHPKIFVNEDFKNTKILYQKLTKGSFEIIVCKSCSVIGHKVNKCVKRAEIDPKDAFKCGLCGLTHFYSDDCDYLK